MLEHGVQPALRDHRMQVVVVDVRHDVQGQAVTPQGLQGAHAVPAELEGLEQCVPLQIVEPRDEGLIGHDAELFREALERVEEEIAVQVVRLVVVLLKRQTARLAVGLPDRAPFDIEAETFCGLNEDRLPVPFTHRTLERRVAEQRSTKIEEDGSEGTHRVADRIVTPNLSVNRGDPR